MGSDKSSSSDDDGNIGNKQGGVYCCCCMDFRRAVIIGASLWLLALVSNYATYANSDNYFDLDDDQVQAAIKIATEEYNGAHMAIFIISLITTTSALVGAIIYNKWMVALSVLWDIVYYIVFTVYGVRTFQRIGDVLTVYATENGTDFDDEQNIVDALIWSYSVIWLIIMIVWIHPRVKLIIEMHKGVMTAKNYPRERASCCCLN